ncbi:3226_t:CDS:2, partial [Funneliformis geosporum]
LETPLQPENKVYDNDQAFDALENMLSNDTEKNITRFEREQDSPIFFAYYTADIFLPGKSNKEKTNAACDLFCGTEYPSFIEFRIVCRRN